MDAERQRLAASPTTDAPWRQWGPYVSARQWGTVREDYSADGDAWRAFPHDHARSRAYRWGEDGLAGICDRWQLLCFGLAMWNGADPILKERLFGLTNAEGNHGEDVKEHWWVLDDTPTHSWMRWLYRYPQLAFPYEALLAESARRNRDEPEPELLDTGVLDGGRFFDVEVAYAKAAPDDVCVRVRAHNAGPDPADLHLLPTLWFRNTWAWGRDDRHPLIDVERTTAGEALRARHATLGTYWLAVDQQPTPTLLVTDNETNHERLHGTSNRGRWVKDGIGDHVLRGAPTVAPERRGTKAAAWWRARVPPGGDWELRLRLMARRPDAGCLGGEHEDVIAARAREAEAFYAPLAPPGTPPEARRVQRAALSGLLWSVKHYRYDVRQWLEGDPAGPPPERRHDRNAHWRHLYNADLVSLPDEWEYPWYAAWDLAFHTVPMALVDPELAKHQLVLLCREWYMHPSGQLPAYEWAFGDVNPPVHAWAAWQVYRADAQATGRPDRAFLARVFHKLLLNFSWWVNRKDATGSNVFEGGFLGMDNIGPFDRSAVQPAGTRLLQSDATSWMAMYSLNLLVIALELARGDRAYEDVATKFFEHFLAIASAADAFGPDGVSLWDDDDGFSYDVLETPDGAQRVRVRSMVGLVPLLAAATIDDAVFRELPDFAARVAWFVKNRAELCRNVWTADVPGEGDRRLLSLLRPDQLRRVLARMLDEQEFLSPHGVRSLSAAHRTPVGLSIGGQWHEVGYVPGESTSAMFGGNSNWRGPVWMPVNALLVEALSTYHSYFGSSFRVELPTGSGVLADLLDVADELARRLLRLWLPGPAGRPVLGADPRLVDDPAWRDLLPFPEYFHGDTGAGLGAMHQTGWTAMVASLVQRLGPGAALVREPAAPVSPNRLPSGPATDIVSAGRGQP
ncbi:MAG TPA: glucosidase [Mycobacteriales bacterium]|nr:glucosidase [Mycobacteriales bacterium]